MGTDNSPNKNINSDFKTSDGLNNQTQNKSFRDRLSADLPQINHPDDSEKLQPIRRHSNIRDSANIHNNLSSKNLNCFDGSLNFNSQNQGNHERPTLVERNKSRKLSQQYCADFKKSYMQNNKSTFLNHLADSLNHGTQIPIEEIEKFKEEYIPKHFFDWRLIEDLKTGIKYWKNYGKVNFEKDFVAKIKKIGNKIGASEPFYLKRSWFYHHLMNNFARSKKENPLFVINRNNILEDSYNALLKNKEINIARPLKIRFVNEQVVDEEGIYREWYVCMFKEFLSPNKKLLILNPYKSFDPNTILFYPKYPGMRLELYEFLGKLTVKAIIDIIVIRNLKINRVLFKSILKRPILLEDIKYFNLDLYQKLKIINDNKVLGNKQLESIRFVWNYIDQNNLVQEAELVPGGRNIFLNDSNKMVFIDKIIYFEAIRPFEDQIKYTQKGLYSLVGKEVEGIFSVEELNFLISGQDNIDLNDWKENTIYKGQYNENHPLIRLFWEKIGRMNKNEIIKFLEFSTGTGSVPIDGFGSLKGVGGRVQKFTIEPYTNYASDNPDQYTFHKIEAKRVYNTIMLPQYRNAQELEQAINIILNS